MAYVPRGDSRYDGFLIPEVMSGFIFESDGRIQILKGEYLPWEKS